MFWYWIVYPPYGSLSLNLGYMPSILIKISGKADIGVFHMSDTVQQLRFNAHASAEKLPLEKEESFSSAAVSSDLAAVSILLHSLY